jgi:hypothetical protein
MMDSEQWGMFACVMNHWKERKKQRKMVDIRKMKRTSFAVLIRLTDIAKMEA